MVALGHLRMRQFMLRHRAIYVAPPRRWTLYGYGVWRDHEHYFNI